MSVAEGTSKLWPVLTALVLMPAVAIGLEQFALRQGTGERVIHVDAAHSAVGRYQHRAPGRSARVGEMARQDAPHVGDAVVRAVGGSVRRA